MPGIKLKILISDQDDVAAGKKRKEIVNTRRDGTIIIVAAAGCAEAVKDHRLGFGKEEEL